MTGSRPPWACLAFVLPVAFLFYGPLLGHSVLYFRDVSLEYFPDYVFVAAALQEGVWPLWNPTCDAGTPFLKAYPVELALLWLLGARGTLAVAPPLHVLVGMWGTFRLARSLGTGPGGAWLAGAGFGLSGLLLSSLLYPSFLAAVWAPWILVTVRSVVLQPSCVGVSRLAVLTALQVSTFGAAVVLQTALAAAVLLPTRPSRRAVGGLAGAGALAMALAAPAWLGALEISRGAARGEGFDASTVLSYSASLPVLAESLWPRLFGDPHTMTGAGYWGQPFYPEGNPFYTSLYLGPLLLLLALEGLEVRLACLAMLGVLLSLGGNGPFSGLLVAVAFLRAPVKYFFLATLAGSLMAGRGFDRLRRDPSRALWGLGPALLMLSVAGLARSSPEGLASIVALLWPLVDRDGVVTVVARHWSSELLASGVLLIAGIASLLPPLRRLPLVPALVALDLLRVNLAVVPLADAGFYQLRAPSRRIVERVAAAPGARLYSFGVAYSPPLAWRDEVLRLDRDVRLFYVDRQALLSRTHVLDGLDAAFDVDRNGWAPPGATLSVGEADPRRYRALHERLRLAAVRFVLSFHSLPPDLVSLRDSVRLPEISNPLGVYEIRDWLPRARLVPAYRVASAGSRGLAPDPGRIVSLEAPPLASDLPVVQPGGGTGRVVHRRVSPHEVRIDASGGAGFVVVAEGWDPGWQAAASDGRRVPLLRANGRYWALPKPEGDVRYSVSFAPAWRRWALGAASIGAAVCGFLLVRGRSAARVADA